MEYLMFDELPDGITWQDIDEAIAKYLGVTYTDAFSPTVSFIYVDALVKKLSPSFLCIDNTYIVSNNIILNKRYGNLKSDEFDLYARKEILCEAIGLLFINMQQQKILP